MYLHIGNNEIVKKEDIIFILNYDILKDNKMYKEFMKRVDEIKLICTKDNIKSVIIIKNNEKLKAYLSNISSVTLSKRKLI